LISAPESQNAPIPLLS